MSTVVGYGSAVPLEGSCLRLNPHALANQLAASSITNTSFRNVMQKAQAASSSARLEYVGHVSVLREPRIALKLIFHRRVLCLL